MKTWVSPWVIIVIILLLAGSSKGCSAKPDEQIIAVSEQAAHDAKITFSLPLEYTATVTQCNSRDGCKTRYYHPRQK